MSAAPEVLDAFEPLGVEARYRAPAAEIDPDPEQGWFRRLSPLLIAHRNLIAAVLLAMLAGAGISLAIPWIVGAALDDALISQTRPLAPLMWLLGGLAMRRGDDDLGHADVKLWSLPLDTLAVVRRICQGPKQPMPLVRRYP